MNIQQAIPRWQDIPEYKSMSMYNYLQYMIKNHGYEEKVMLGRIGQGTKIHKLHVTCKIENDNIYIADVVSFCGSKKWKSNLKLYCDQDHICNCNRC